MSTKLVNGVADTPKQLEDLSKEELIIEVLTVKKQMVSVQLEFLKAKQEVLIRDSQIIDTKIKSLQTQKS